MSPGEKPLKGYLFWILAAAAVVAAVWIVQTIGEAGKPAWGAPSSAGTHIWPASGRLLLGTAAFAVLSAIFAALIALPVGIRLGEGAGRIAFIAILPVFMPAHIAAYVWRLILEDAASAVLPGISLWHSVWWRFIAAAWTFAAMYWPLIAFPVALGMRLHGNRLAQEMATLAPRGTIFRRAVLPGLMPVLLAGAGIFFLLALANYAVPLMWDIPSLNVAMYGRLVAFESPRSAMALSIPLQALALLFCLCGVMWLRARHYAGDIGQAMIPQERSQTGKLLPVLSNAVILITVGVPVAALLMWHNPFHLIRADWVGGGVPLKWGLILAALGASGAVILAFVLAEGARKAGKAFSIAVEIVGLLSLFLPATILCFAASGARSILLPLYESVAIFFILYGWRFFYIPWKLIRAAESFERPEHEELARIIGLSPFARTRLRLAGIMRLALCASWLIVFALTLGELEIAMFFVQPGREPLGVFLDNLMHHGRSTAVVQWSLVIILAEALIASAALWAGSGQWRKLSVRT